MDTGLFVFGSLDEALPILGNKVKLLQMCSDAPGGCLEMLIGGMPYTLDASTVIGLERKLLEQTCKR